MGNTVFIKGINIATKRNQFLPHGKHRLHIRDKYFNVKISVRTSRETPSSYKG
jgi:hypothetical protein